VCNLYSITKSQQAMRDVAGNLLPLPGVFPDKMAPVTKIRNTK
jgi:hypothetical protein